MGSLDAPGSAGKSSLWIENSLCLWTWGDGINPTGLPGCEVPGPGPGPGPGPLERREKEKKRKEKKRKEKKRKEKKEKKKEKKRKKKRIIIVITNVRKFK